MLALESSPLALRFEPDPPPVPHDRRHGGRVRSTGTAIVHGPFAAHGRIVDLANGGLSLLVDDAAEVPDVGAHVRLDVRLDGLGRWMSLKGAVVRLDPRGSAVALVIELLTVPPEFEDLVQDELMSAVECSQYPSILLVDLARGRRELVAAAFRATGYDVIEVSSPLEAISAVDQSRLHLWAVVIADTEIASHAAELRRFLRETHPRVPLIVVGEHIRRPGAARVRMDGIDDLAVHLEGMVGALAHRGGSA